ncbi:MAG: IS200/IS605 family transposase [Acidobacteriota bacterium]
MASSLANLLYHIVFSTKGRQPLVTEDLREPLFRYIGSIVLKHRGILLEIGGMPDHLHCLVKCPPSLAMSSMLRAIKSDSSAWVSRRHPDRFFAWQRGYGAFTVSASQVEVVRRYIRNQEAHHGQWSFEEEYLQMLERHGVEYDERFLWN